MPRKDKHTNGRYRRYPPPFTMSPVGWLTLGILIGIIIGLICTRISE